MFYHLNYVGGSSFLCNWDYYAQQTDVYIEFLNTPLRTFQLAESNLFISQEDSQTKFLVVTGSGSMLEFLRDDQLEAGGMFVPLEQLIGVEIVQVSFSQSHILVISVDGYIYSWGSGNCGQLGHGDTLTSNIPKIIESLNPHLPNITLIKRSEQEGAEQVMICYDHWVVQIAAGDEHVLILNENGQVYSLIINFQSTEIELISEKLF